MFCMLCCFLDPAFFCLVSFFEPCLFAFLMISSPIRRVKGVEHLSVCKLWPLEMICIGKSGPAFSGIAFQQASSSRLLSCLLVLLTLQNVLFPKHFRGLPFTKQQQKIVSAFQERVLAITKVYENLGRHP